MSKEFVAIGIKNMVCPRCLQAVHEGLKTIECDFDEVSLGWASIDKDFSLTKVEEMLLSLGFELLASQEQKLVESIKNNLITLLQLKEGLGKEKLSTWLSNKLGKDYTQLSNLFSEIEGFTIERYFIKLRIEKVKELLVYNELNLKEISHQLGFSSVAHLSAQFKKETGFTITHFKALGSNKRLFIDML